MAQPKNLFHWADVVAERIIQEKGNKDSYTVASGITPSGTIHIGNFREIITVDLVTKALRDRGKKVRFIYSWDDYDVFRKVPKNMPKQDVLTKNLRKSIVDVPDTHGEHENYARHHESKVEAEVPLVGINPEFIYQSKKYKKCDYAESIKVALQNNETIKKALNNYRKEPLAAEWLPLTGFCPDCDKDNISFSDYDGDYGLMMKCYDCKKDIEVDIRKAPFVKLPWRVDWPMRWAYESVDFEPGGKDHSTEGGSFSTGKEIVKIFDWTPPTYQVYDFIRIKGGAGKISSSSGDVITLGDCLDIYEPELVRWLFSGTRPNTEFAISFDADVIKIYEDFDKCERIYFGKEEVNDKEKEKQKRVYELSMVNETQKKIPVQPSFRHLTNVLLGTNYDLKKTKDYYKDEVKTDFDKVRLDQRINCAKNWLEKYAPSEFKYEIQEKVPQGLSLKEEEKNALKDLAHLLLEKNITEEKLYKQFGTICKNNNIQPKDFFKATYQVLINRERGPPLASFVIAIGQKKVAELFSSV